jgi:diketogulonate reductase-like aldo/keto reductase
MEAFRALYDAGKIRHYGVSNLDANDMEELWTVPGGREVQTDQVLYNLARRGVEWDLLPWLRARRLPVMAYSPIEQGQLLRNPALADFARRYRMTPAQAALAWLLKGDDVIVIPKAAHRERLKENIGALGVRLSPEQLAELDALFPPPRGPRPLDML